jgi:hypothetical protein
MTSAFHDPAIRADGGAITTGLWARRVVLVLGAVLPVIALLNVLGQQPRDTDAATAAASVSLSAPATVRGGLLFQSRLDIRAARTIDHLRLVLDDGWVEGMQLSSIEPQATAESSHQGRVVLSYGRLRAGDRLIVWIQSQVDPTNPGRRRAGITLEDSLTPIARVDRTLTVLP